MIRESIEAAVKEALQSLQAGDVSFVVERPGDMAHGDYSTNAALAASKALKKNPREVAEQLKGFLEEKFSKNKSSGFLVKLFGGNSLPSVEKIEVAGAGFINFYLSREAIAQEVQRATKDVWGKNTLYGAKRVMVEYTQPNPFKPFHIGHLMSNTIGESITRLGEYAGAEVKRANYQGDVGPHVAKAIYILLKNNILQPTIEQIGAAYVEGNKLYEENEEIKKEIDEINKKVYERSDEQINALYDWGRKISLERFEEIYKILGTKFDHYFFESETGPIGLKVVKKHPEVFEESEGATVFKGEQYGLHTRVFVNKLGLPTYEAKELGLVEAKKAKGTFDLSLTITANETVDYFKVVRKAAELVFPDMEGKMMARFHGLLRLTTGKMSSRLGNVITGESLLADLTEDAKEKMKDRNLPNTDEIAQQVAVGAIKYEVLKQGSGKDIIFDPEKSLSLEGDSGPYLQYAHTRALSLLKAAKEAGIRAEISLSGAAGHNGDASESDISARSVLERTLLHFPDAVERAAKELEPHYVTTYITELASAFNSWYANERVIGGSNPRYGVLLAEAVEKTLAKGLYVLGMQAPEKM